jgi:hypothetical protein
VSPEKFRDLVAWKVIGKRFVDWWRALKINRYARASFIDDALWRLIGMHGISCAQPPL